MSDQPTSSNPPTSPTGGPIMLNDGPWVWGAVTTPDPERPTDGDTTSPPDRPGTPEPTGTQNDGPPVSGAVVAAPETEPPANDPPSSPADPPSAPQPTVVMLNDGPAVWGAVAADPAPRSAADNGPPSVPPQSSTPPADSVGTASDRAAPVELPHTAADQSDGAASDLFAGDAQFTPAYIFQSEAEPLVFDLMHRDDLSDPVLVGLHKMFFDWDWV